MQGVPVKAELAEDIRRLAQKDFSPHYGERRNAFKTHPLWRRLRQLGSELWLDTGSLEEASEIWTREFTALTTNNTLLNREVQTGRYDDLIAEGSRMLAEHGLSQRQRVLEIDFLLNARHGLRLVEEFDAFVSVEEHTDLAGDVDAAVECGRRYHEICRERFIVKVPFTPAGLLASRRLAAEGVPVNLTLGFSARQNYVAARIARPAYLNVFLGRLNSFVIENDLGDGSYVGERATVASQAVLRRLHEIDGLPCRQIGASFRGGGQVRDLIGVNVMTLPPKVAREFERMNVPAGEVRDRTGEEYHPELRTGVDPDSVRLETLWHVEEKLVLLLDALEREDLDSFTPNDLVSFFAKRGGGDVLVPWSGEEIALSAAEGKIPRLEHWREALASRRIGLDSLMNLAGLNSFATDQKAMDDRVRSVLAKSR